MLRELLLAQKDVTQEEFADALGVTRYSVNQLVNDRRAVTAEMALRLSRALGTSPEFWLNLQRAVDLQRATKRLGDSLDTIRVVRAKPTTRELFADSN